MAKINLDEGTIQVAGEWLTREELVARIQEMMATGEMRISKLAGSLEQLDNELDGAEKIHVVIPENIVTGINNIMAKEKISVGDVVRNALSSYLGSGERRATPDRYPSREEPVEEEEEEETEEEEEEEYEEEEAEEEEEEETEEEEWGKPKKKAATKIKCPKCGSPIIVESDERPLEITCDNCGARGRLR